MSSRFFKGSDTSDSEDSEHELYSGEEEESSSGEESSEGSDEEDDSSSSGSSSDDGLTGANRFLKADKDADSDEESDEEKVTVVRSARDKRFEEAEAVVRAIDNAVKINDWSVISTEFDKLNRLIPNLVKVLEGTNPKFYSAYSSHRSARRSKANNMCSQDACRVREYDE
jgi:translation initiation factor 3 subunit C